MTQRHAIATGVGPASVLDLVARALLTDEGWGDAAPLDAPRPAAPFEGDVLDDLVQAAVANSRRLAIASRMWLPDDDRGQKLAQIMVNAITLGMASSAAVNIAAQLVGAVAAGKEDEVALTITRASSVLDEQDLIGGSAALMTALTLAIAEALDLEPSRVEFEMRDAV